MSVHGFVVNVTGVPTNSIVRSAEPLGLGPALPTVTTQLTGAPIGAGAGVAVMPFSVRSERASAFTFSTNVSETLPPRPSTAVTVTLYGEPFAMASVATPEITPRREAESGREAAHRERQRVLVGVGELRRDVQGQRLILVDRLIRNTRRHDERRRIRERDRRRRHGGRRDWRRGHGSRG